MKDLNDNNNGMKDWSKEILSPMEAWTVASNMNRVDQMRNLSFDDWWFSIKATIVFLITFSLTDSVVASIIACIVVPWGLSKLIQAIFKKRN